MTPGLNWYKVEIFTLTLDLTPLLAQLAQRGILYRVTEEASGQCLWLSNAEQAEQMREYLREHGIDSFLSPAVAETSPHQPVTAGGGQQFLARKLIDAQGALVHYPVVMITILLGIGGALLVHFDPRLEWVKWLTYQPVQLMGQYIGLASAATGLERGEYWRMLTPIFLHFGLFHILFNALWVWEFGRRIELGLGSARLLVLILLIGVISNTAQYLWTGPSLFGGLSGVLYGLMGFLWIYNRLRPHPLFALQPGIIGFMLLWVVLGMTGAIDFFMDGSIANAAHVGGLAAGMALAPLAARFPH